MSPNHNAGRDSATPHRVPTLLRELARRIAAERHSVDDADRFLDLVTRLVEGRTIRHSEIGGIGTLLETDEERHTLSQLVSSAISESSEGESVEALTALSFLVEDRSPADAEVVAFVEHGIRSALVRRGSGQQSREKHFNHHDARATLIAARDVFEEHGKRFFLDRGTLLGAIRENGFIANDYDIDVGIFADEVSLADVKTMFESTDFALNQDFEFKVGLISPTGIQVDFFLTTRERGYFLSKGYRSIHNWYFSPFDLMEYPFLGSTFYVPDTYEKHLDENYGNWRSPALFYDLSYNEPCVAYGQDPYPLGYLTRRMSSSLRSGRRYLSNAPAIRLRDQFGIDYSDWFPRSTVPPVMPDVDSRRTRRPIVIVDDTTQYSHRLRRIVESALSITSDVDLAIDGDQPNAADQLVVAGAIDRIRGVVPVSGLSEASLSGLLASSPRALVVPPKLADEISARFAQKAVLAGCDLVVFDDDSVALTIDNRDRVTVRQRTTATR